MIFIKVIRKNQIIVFVLALLLVTVGYISYKPGSETNFVSTTLDNSAVADIGDATLVSSSSIVNSIEQATSNTKDTSNTLTNDVSSTNNTTATDSDISDNEETTVDNYFADTRLERQRMYSESLDSYQKLADNPNIPATQKSIITNEITKINNLQNAIMIAENLIMNKGVDDVVILVNDDSVNAIVKTKDLSKALVAQIQNIVTRELNAKIENVHISSR